MERTFTVVLGTSCSACRANTGRWQCNTCRAIFCTACDHVCAVTS